MHSPNNHIAANFSKIPEDKKELHAALQKQRTMAGIHAVIAF